MGPSKLTSKVKYMGPIRLLPVMPNLGNGMLGCYRCAYVWRPRKSPVRLCPRCKSRLWNAPKVARVTRRVADPSRGVAGIIGPHRVQLARLAREFQATDLRIFGSVARGEATPQSDVDLLVKFRRPIGLLRRIEFQERAEKILGHPVDLATEGNLHWLARPQILAEAVSL